MKKLKFKLIYLGLIITNIIFIFVNVSNYQFTNKQVLEKLKSTELLKTKEIAQKIDLDLQSLNKIGETIALSSNNLKYDSTHYIQTKKYLDTTLKSILKNNYRIETAYTFFRPDMQIKNELPYVCIISNNRNPATFNVNTLQNFDYWNQDWYKLGKISDNFSWTEPYLEVITGRNLISGVKKLVDDKGNFIGVSGIDISLDNINKLLENVPKNDESKAYLISNKGTYIHHPNNTLILKKNIKDDYLSFLQKYTNKSTYGFIEHNDKYYFYYKLISNSWYIILEQSDSTIRSFMKISIAKSFILMLLGNILIIGMLIAVLKNKKAEATIKSIAYYNSCTGLPNMNYVNNNLHNNIEKIIVEGATAAIMVLDIDNFKAVNDNFGHKIGDEFLRTIAKNFTNILLKSDKVFHTGGDEFIFFISSIRNKEDIRIVAQELLDIFHKDIYIDNNKINYITASIGISFIPQNGSNVKDALNCADDAMHYAKIKGKNKYEFYTIEMHSRILQDINFEKELMDALNNNELVSYYQPKFDGKTGELLGMESLVRWIKPDGRIIPPNRFIEFAEKRAIIVSIGEKILNIACKQNKLWQDKGYKKVPIAVNLSAGQLLDEQFIKKIQDVLNEIGLEPQYLELEITESMIMNNFEKNIQTLQAIKNLGIKLSLDDFGTGYSSLNYLRILPIDKVKIDKSFINDIVKDSKTQLIAISIIKLLHNMNFKVVAEGVEYKEQLDILNELNCDEIQGFLFSKPIPPEELENFF